MLLAQTVLAGYTVGVKEAGVNPFIAYEQFWLRFFDFRGRSSRAEFWFVVLINVLLSILFSVGARTSTLVGYLATIYALATTIPGLALTVRRLHDSDHRGWWVLISLVPILGALVLIYFEVLPSTPGPNRFGLPSRHVSVPDR